MSENITSPTPEAPATPAEAPIEAEVIEGAEGEAPAAAPKAPTPPPANRKKLLNIKVDGREEAFELDLDNEDELKKHVQMSRAAQKRMQEVAEYKKNVNSFFETLKADPLRVLTDPNLGIPDEVRRKMAESIINNEIEEMQKTPEQREKEKLTRELERLKKQNETEKQNREQAEFKRLQEQAAVQLDTDITSAIDSSGLPKTARTVRYMAEALMYCLENNLDLSAKDLVPYIRKQTLGDFKEIVGSLPDEELENWLGKENLGRIRKRNLARIKNAGDTSAVKPTGDSLKKKEEKPQEKISFKDFMRGLSK